MQSEVSKKWKHLRADNSLDDTYLALSNHLTMLQSLCDKYYWQQMQASTSRISFRWRHIRAGNMYNWLHRPNTSIHAVVMATIGLFTSDVSRALVVRRHCSWTHTHVNIYLLTYLPHFSVFCSTGFLFQLYQDLLGPQKTNSGDNWISFYRPDAHPVSQPCQRTAGKTWTCTQNKMKRMQNTQ